MRAVGGSYAMAAYQRLFPFCLALLVLSACGQVEDALRDTQNWVTQTIQDANSLVGLSDIDARKSMCSAQSGQWIDTLVVGVCSNGRVTLSLDGNDHDLPCTDGAGATDNGECAYEGSDGVYYNDGPSSPAWAQALSAQLGSSLDQTHWNRLFWDAAVNHDYCYHDNGATYGYSKDDCDDQFLSDLAAVCAEPDYTKISWFNKADCEKNAALYVSAVRFLGQTSFDVQDTEVHYPDWTPLYKRMGLRESDMASEKSTISGKIPSTSPF